MKEKIKKFRDLIKELKKTPKGRAILFFGFYLLFFLILAVVARISPKYTTSIDDYKGNDLSDTALTAKNYKYDYTISVDGINYNYSGVSDGTSQLFTYTVDSVEVQYYKNSLEYFKNNNGLWIKTDNPYLYEEFLDYNKISDIFVDASYISRTEFESGEAIYNFQIATANIVEKLDKTDIDIEDIPNDVKFSTDSEGQINKIELNLSSYGKYKNICNNTFFITLNYSDFGNISEIVSPID